MDDGVLIYFGFPQAHEDDAEAGPELAGAPRSAVRMPQTTMAATASIMKWPANIARRVSNPLQAASKLARYRDAARRLIRSRGRSNVFGLQP
jgi:hypothetical protein